MIDTSLTEESYADLNKSEEAVEEGPQTRHCL